MGLPWQREEAKRTVLANLSSDWKKIGDIVKSTPLLYQTVRRALYDLIEEEKVERKGGGYYRLTNTYMKKQTEEEVRGEYDEIIGSLRPQEAYATINEHCKSISTGMIALSIKMGMGSLIKTIPKGTIKKLGIDDFLIEAHVDAGYYEWQEQFVLQHLETRYPGALDDYCEIILSRTTEEEDRAHRINFEIQLTYMFNLVWSGRVLLGTCQACPPFKQAVDAYYRDGASVPKSGGKLIAPKH